jgi:hypothetical protein
MGAEKGKFGDLAGEWRGNKVLTYLNPDWRVARFTRRRAERVQFSRL